MLPPGKYSVTYGRGPEYRDAERARSPCPTRSRTRRRSGSQRWIKLADYGWYLGRSSRPRGRLRPLRSADRRRAAGRHDAAHPGRRPERRLRALVGAVLVLPEAVLRGQGAQALAARQPDAVRRRSLRLSQLARRAPVPAAAEGRRLPRHDADRGVAELGPAGLQWGKEQGGVVGFSHSGWGLQVPAKKLPTYDMPPFDGIGANEYIVDVVHDACDFISAVDTPAIWELNIWYHTLNCGYTARISGETDFPCIYGDRVGLGRVYVEARPRTSRSTTTSWVDGIRDGRSYCCDGLSHLFDFTVGRPGRRREGRRRPGQRAGGQERQAAGDHACRPRRCWTKSRDERHPQQAARSEAVLARRAGAHRRHAQGAGRADRQRPVRSRRRRSRPTARCSDLTFRLHARAFELGGGAHLSQLRTPTRCSSRSTASRSAPASKSAQWCLDAVDVCWKQKVKQTRAAEQPAAAAAYDVARKAYAKILAESQVD